MNNMLLSGRARSSMTLAAVLVLAAISLFAGQPAENSSEEEKRSEAPVVNEEPPRRMTVEEARERSRALQLIYEASLHMMHHYYFDDDQRLRIPAKALEDVFKATDAQTGSETHWISVNAPPMNVDNKPDTAFEKKAALELTAGQEEYELVKDGKYYRAGAITLRGTCLHCHVSALSEKVSELPVAAVVTIMPVVEE